MFQVKSSNESVLDLIKLYDTKIKHAHTMRDATRFRQTNLLLMYIVDDVFELYEELEKFHKNAQPYRTSRDALLSMPITKEEERLHKLMELKVSASYPLSNSIVSMLESGVKKENIQKSINKLRIIQTELFEIIDEFVLLQTQHGEDAFNSSRQQFDDDIYVTSGVGFVAILIAIIISHYVTKFVFNTNKQLQMASDDMEKAYKEAEEATEIKSEFLATMSHEIRTPLTAIIGFAETTLYSKQGMEQRLNAIKTIIQSGKHLLQIVNDILDLSKIEAKKLEIELSEVSIFDVINEVEGIEKNSANEKGIGFYVRYHFPFPATIFSDELRVKQVLLNLCSNAVKFTREGKVVINVKSDIEKNILIFEVCDTGIGISKELQKVIFEPYRQADSSTTRKFGGTGLGLSLSKLLAKRMEGDITVVSEIGKGSKFVFTLPCNSEVSDIIYSDKDIPEKTSSKTDLVSVDSISGYILLAEDNIDNQELFKIYLSRLGLKVDIVENGQLAVDAVKVHDYDLILMDIRMPVMDGLEAVTLIREGGYEKPIIAVTANAMQEDKENCFNVGCSDFLSKPIDAKKLSIMLEKYLKTNTSDKKLSHKNGNSEETVISSLLISDPKMLGLVRKFIGNLEGEIKSINEQILNDEYAHLAENIHKLKGTSGNYGFPSVAGILANMEFQVLNKNKSELLILLGDLKKQYENILLGLEDYSN